MWTVHSYVPRILLQSLQSVIMVLANNIIPRQTHTYVWSIESDIPVQISFAATNHMRILLRFIVSSVRNLRQQTSKIIPPMVQIHVVHTCSILTSDNCVRYSGLLN